MTVPKISKAEFMKLWNSDKTLKQIADDLGTKAYSISYYAKSRGIPARPRPQKAAQKKPEKQDRNKINISRWPELKEMWNADVPISEIAAHFGCSRNLVLSTVKRIAASRSQYWPKSTICLDHKESEGWMMKPTERKIYAMLRKAAPNVVSFEDLEAALWPTNPPADTRRNIQTHVCYLRPKLPEGQRILSEYNIGYMLYIKPIADRSS